MNTNIYLIGMPGSGKTVTAQALAHKLSKKFSDTDEMIVKRTDRAITTIFATLGEDYFRDLETEALLEVMKLGSCVVATGGGIVLKEHNWELMNGSGKVVYLKTSPDVILKRTERSADRPLLKAENSSEKMKKIIELLDKRSRLYEKADLVCVTDGKTSEQVAEEIGRMVV